MKVVIAATAYTPAARIDLRFGRCAFFAVYDTVEKSLSFCPNPYQDAEEWSGKLSLEWVIAQGASTIIAGEFGIKIKPLLDQKKIQLIILKNSELRVYDIIKMLDNQYKTS